MNEKRIFILAACVLLVVTVAGTRSAQIQPGPQSHSDWVAASLKKIETIKVGMTRADLLRVFAEEGGLSTRTQRQYVYRECSYIKVAVEFEPVGEKEPPTFSESSADRITKISKPFIEWSILD